MAMTMKKITAGYSQYLYEAINDQAASATAGYYTAEGNPPGVWVGGGLGMVGHQTGDTVTKVEAERLLDQLKHPLSGQPLKPSGIHHANPMNPHDNSTVAGYDLTFTMPKDLSILMETCPPRMREQLRVLWDRSVSRSLEQWERQCAYTRTGRGGGMRMKVQGVAGQAYTHYTNREGEAHWHTHVAISNMVACPDGKIRSLDGRLAYANAGAISEKSTHIFLQSVATSLGLVPERKTSMDGRKSVWGIRGVTDQIITATSSRRARLLAKEKQLIRQWQDAHPGERMGVKLRRLIDRQAWAATRKAKPADPPSFARIRSRMRHQLEQAGISDVDAWITTLTGHTISMSDPHTTDSGHMLSQIAQIAVNELADQHDPHQPVRQDLAYDDDATRQRKALHAIGMAAGTGKTSFTLGDIHRVVEHLTSGIYYSGSLDEADQAHDQLVDQISSRVTDTLIPIHDDLYQIPDAARGIPQLIDAATGSLTFEHHGIDRRYATRSLWQAEDIFLTYATADAEAPLSGADTSTISQLLDDYSASSGTPLGDDQKQAAISLLTTRRRVTGLNGLAGTGKTTTLRAVKHVLDQLGQAGRIIGASPSNRGANELEASLSLPCENVTAIINEHDTHANEHAISRLTRQLSQDDSLTRSQRDDIRQELTRRIASRERLTIPEHGIIIIDEAGMADTMSMSRLVQAAQEQDATLLLVGDTHQLDAPGDGQGCFQYLVDHQQTATLTGIHRFTAPEEAQATINLAEGATSGQGDDFEYQAIHYYKKQGRIHAGSDETMIDAAFHDTLHDLENGVNAILISASNLNLARLNARFSQALQDDGKVVADSDQRMTFTMDGNTYGAGDIICTRTGDRHQIASDGQFLRNGDLWRIRTLTWQGDLNDPARRAGQALLESVDSGRPDATIHVDINWLADNAMGGYAHTIHRAQGATVTHCRTYIGEDTTMTRSSLYVAASRGRESNMFYIATPDPDTAADPDHNLLISNYMSSLARKYQAQGRVEYTGSGANPDPSRYYTKQDLKPTSLMLAERQLNHIINNNPLRRLAHEEKKTDHRQSTSLKTLTQERISLNRLLAEDDMSRLLTHSQGDERLTQLKADPDQWARLTTSWINARATDPQQADRILTSGPDEPAIHDSDNALFDMDPSNPAGRLAARLDATHTRMQPADYHPNDPDDKQKAILDLLDQNSRLLDARWRQIHHTVLSDNRPLWVRKLGRIPTTPAGQASWWDLIRDISLYRALEDKTGSDTILGPSSRRHHDNAWRNQLSRRITAFTHPDTQQATDPSLDAAPTLPADMQDLPFNDDYYDPLSDAMAPPDQHTDPPASGQTEQPAQDDTGSISTADPSQESHSTTGGKVPSAAIQTDIPAPDMDAATQKNEPVLDIDHMGAQEKIDYLASRAAASLTTPIPTYQRTPYTPPTDQMPTIDRVEYRMITRLNQEAWDHWKEHTAASWVPAYAASRGIDPTNVAYTYAGRYHNDLTAWATHHGYNVAQLVNAGLATATKNGKYYDVFQDRMAIPIRDTHGNIIAFTARENPSSPLKSRYPKYMNTRGTAAYQKQYQLLGIDQNALKTLEDPHDHTTVILCEGGMDQISLAQACQHINRTGATWLPAAPCGTALTEHQLNTIRHANHGHLPAISLCFDNDPAGQTATARAFDMLTDQEKRTTTVITLPDGYKDPGEMIQNGKQIDLAAEIITATPAWKWLVDHRYHDSRLDTAWQMDDEYARMTAAITSLWDESDPHRSIVDHYIRQAIDSTNPDLAGYLTDKPYYQWMQNIQEHDPVGPRSMDAIQTEGMQPETAASGLDTVIAAMNDPTRFAQQAWKEYQQQHPASIQQPGISAGA